MDSGLPENADIDLDADTFHRSLIRSLSGTLEEVVGIGEASGFISVVGRELGNQINDKYREAMQTDQLSREQVAEVLVDLKARVGGDFYIIESDEETIVLGNRRCPFGEMVEGRTSMCMMTSNVFGTIAAENLGYGAVELQETIAEGAPGCRVKVYLRPDHGGASTSSREYFKE